MLQAQDKDAFLTQGFVGPLTSSIAASSLDEIAVQLEEITANHMSHPIYKRFSVRDWHLVNQGIGEIFKDEEILARVKDILGEDLILWRTKVFRKRPGEGPLGWHQEWGYFNGEEIGNDVTGLQPNSINRDSIWNLTVWIALEDITEEMGPIRFASGTHRRRFPVQMASMKDSEFWHDPFLDINETEILVKRATTNSLILDIDTSSVFRDVEVRDLSLADAKSLVLAYVANKVGAVTVGFNPLEETVVTCPMRKGQFVIFTERTMHGSSANTSSRRRLAINGRITKGDTIVYPGRLKGEYIDGRIILNEGLHREASALWSSAP